MEGNNVNQRRHTTDGQTFVIRKAKIQDCPQLLGFIQGLAKYQSMTDLCTMTLPQLEKDGFGNQPLFHAFVIEEEESKQIVGHAINYFRYSTFTGKQLHVEDIFILENHRRKGLAYALMHTVAQFASQEGCTALDWSCLSWNLPAVSFYLSLGAVNTTINDKWESYSLHGGNFQKLVDGKSNV